MSLGFNGAYMARIKIFDAGKMSVFEGGRKDLLVFFSIYVGNMSAYKSI